MSCTCKPCCHAAAKQLKQVLIVLTFHLQALPTVLASLFACTAQHALTLVLAVLPSCIEDSGGLRSYTSTVVVQALLHYLQAQSATNGEPAPLCASDLV